MILLHIWAWVHVAHLVLVVLHLCMGIDIFMGFFDTLPDQK